MPKNPGEKPGFQSANQGGMFRKIWCWIVVCFNWFVDFLGKVGVPLIAASLVFAASTLQNRITSMNLLSEREKAESELRASMFKSLIEPFVGKGGSIPPDREQLLVELLALNFHEHFELKPLLERVDQNLTLRNPERIKARKESLRSITRRLIDRQISIFIKEDTGKVPVEKQARVFTLRIIAPPEKRSEVELCERVKGLQDEALDNEDIYIKALCKQAKEPFDKPPTVIQFPIPDLTSPDEKHRFELVVQTANWKADRFTVLLYECLPKPNPCSQTQAIKEFQISPSWSDLPL
ncbi:MAG: hypothetical protein KGL32_10000, partial [candidate division NC10 bacterium]|nr:hypothetical protein [candidate division NC10 bacterium]